MHGRPSSATKAKIFGVLMCLEFLIQLQKISHEVKSVTFYGDNETSLDNINNLENRECKKNLDLLLEIQYLRRKLGYDVKAIYVKSHQDREMNWKVFHHT